MNVTQVRSKDAVDVESVVCNLCGSTAAEVLYDLTDIRHHGPGKFRLQRCAQCGLMYLSPRPVPASIGAYYPSSYTAFRPAIEDEKSFLMRWMRRRKLAQRRRLVERYAGRRAGRVLDVGCATGLYLHEMAQAGWQALGVELTPDAADYARTRFG